MRIFYMELEDNIKIAGFKHKITDFKELMTQINEISHGLHSSTFKCRWNCRKRTRTSCNSSRN